MTITEVRKLAHEKAKELQKQNRNPHGYLRDILLDEAIEELEAQQKANS